jgi:dihydroorotate dehydrogenase
LPSEIVIISVGGVFSPTDVSQRLELGASLVQGYTGFVYEGPLWARKINRGLK